MSKGKSMDIWKIKIIAVAFVLIVALVFSVLSVRAQSLYQSPQYSSPPNPFSYYSGSIDTYWPAFGKEECLARQDFIVEILPGAYSPAVIRSDLLEEQDVPVFAQLTGVKINPLIEVPEITSISFKGQQLPKEIAGIGFHPARAALQTYGSTLLGSPVLNNLGYLVVVVRRQPIEKNMTEWIEANLTALIQYNAEKALGIGRASFKLPVLTDDEWQQYYKQYSFWNGKAYLRALEIGKDSSGEYARIGVYLDSSKQLTSIILRPGQQTPQPIYLPGYYCSAGLNLNLNKIASPEIKAKIRVGDDELWLAKGQRFLDENCWIYNIEPNMFGGGEVTISCKDGGPYYLTLDPPKARITITGKGKEIISEDFDVGDELVPQSGIFLAFIGNTEKALSRTLREQKKDFIILVKPKETTTEKSKETIAIDFRSLNIIVKKILQGRKFSFTWTDFWNFIKLANPKAEKSKITLFKEINCLETGCTDSLNSELKKVLTNFEFRIIVPAELNDGSEWPGTGYYFKFDKTIGSIEKRYDGISDYSKLLEKYFNEAKENYEKVAEYYGKQKKKQQEGAKPDYYGADALYKAAELAAKLKKLKTQEDLLEEIIKKYPDSAFAEKAESDLKISRLHDRTKASTSIFTNGQSYYVSLEDIQEPTEEDKSVELFVNEKTESYTENDVIPDTTLTIKLITDEWIEFSYQDNEGREISGVRLKEGEDKTFFVKYKQAIKQVHIRIKKINLKKEASVTLEPLVMKAQTETNFTFKIGIEKRAIKLSPEKTQELINELNTSIAQWETIVNNLGNLVKAWKGTCFATSTYFLVKNFFTNLGGGSIAREKVMRSAGGWWEICTEKVNAGEESFEGSTTDVKIRNCLRRYNPTIESQIGTLTNCIENVNTRVEDTQAYTAGGGIFNLGKSINQEASRKAYIKELSSEGYTKDFVSGIAEGKPTKGDDLSTLKTEDVFKNLNISDALSSDLRDIDLWACVHKYSVQDTELRQMARKNLYKELDPLSKSIAVNKAKKELDNLLKETTLPNKLKSSYTIRRNERGLVTYNLPMYSFEEQYLNEYEIGEEVKNDILSDLKRGALVSTIDFDYITTTKEDILGSEYNTNYAVKHFFATFLFNTNTGRYELESLYQLEVPSEKDAKPKITKKMPKEDPSKIKAVLGIKDFEKVDISKCKNQIKKLEAKFWDTEPYTGLPALLPIDKNNGWYVAVNPPGKGIPAFEASGRLVNFYLCNVGEDGIMDYFTRPNQDECRGFFLDQTSQQPLQFFCITDPAEVATLIDKAQRYVYDAAEQYKRNQRKVSLPGIGEIDVTKPPAAIPGTECEDFMSPSDCNLLFNVCDPVLCPASRCDFGGRYPVEDVVQTGIIGSIALCLPNAQEGIIVPICLTGVHAGLENFVMTMKAVRDCLQEELRSGRTVGICDEIKSVYLCEFFWKQAIPLIKIGLPKIFEVLSGRGTHGGGEYLTVQDSWSKLEQSVDYFTNYYGVNALKAFQARSTAEAGTEVCRAWVSARYPNSADFFDKLLEPESPTQFYAKFSEDVMTEATVPPTSHYKVYYRIYAGKDQGVYYQVYLKGTPASKYYEQISGMEMNVPGSVGYIPRGEQVDRAVDFTGPSGYKELCVRINMKEECGFGQVTTSFAFDELKNIYLENQATQPVKTEKECVEGTGGLIPAILSPNLQAGIEESIQPAIYKRGLIRICATNNPGLSTDPGRWSDIGYCDKDQKIKCWLDTHSLNQSISDTGIISRTLDKAKELATKIDEEEAWNEERSNTELRDVNEKLLPNTLKELDKILDSAELKSAKASYVEDRIEDTIKDAIDKFKEIILKAWFNEQKAEAQFSIAEIYYKITDKLYEFVKTFVPEEAKAEKGKTTEEVININLDEESSVEELFIEGEKKTLQVNGKTYDTWISPSKLLGVAAAKAGVRLYFISPRGEEWREIPFVNEIDINNDGKNDFSVSVSKISKNEKGKTTAEIKFTNPFFKRLRQNFQNVVEAVGDFFTPELEAAPSEESSEDNWAGTAYSASDFQKAKSESNFQGRQNLYILVDKYAKQYDVNFNLVRAIIEVESKWNPQIPPSASGAVGLMQLKDSAIDDMKSSTGACAKSMGIISINKYNTEQNINGGVRYFACQLKRFGNLNLALAAYKAGPTAVANNCQEGIWSKCKSKFDEKSQVYPDSVKEAYKLFAIGTSSPSTYAAETAKQKKIVIDAGHGGTDPGAVSSIGIKEKDINLQLAKKLKSILESKGYSVKMTRDTDISTSLASRVKIANDFGADLFISIHVNSAKLDIDSRYCSASGAETYYYRTSEKGREIAELVQENVVNAMGNTDRGIKKDTESAEGSLYVLRNTNMPAILIEPGFICNEEDISVLYSSTEQEQIAAAISQGISAIV